MALLWHGVMPVLTRIYGYFPARLLGLGEDIPAGIAMQWAARRSPEFRPEATTADTGRANLMLARYSMVKGDVLKISFTDDAFATRAGGERLMSAFPSLRTVSVEVSPEQAGMSDIGHFGFFRRDGAQRLWPFVLGYIRDGTSLFGPAT